ncbi:MAG: hypothetical protein U0L74_09925 [Paludibacteraceae bacterium]|nr:hypothetical protein [Paludibacteraceae bacterium]
MKIRAFITHKKAEHFIDCQDRFSINPDTKSVALSDGMSTSWQQKLWAEILVNEFTSKDWAPTPEAVKELSPKWKKGVEEFIRELKDKGVSENIIYRNERNLAERKSACATFVGVRFKDDFNWECDVLGDSCLIVKNNKEYEFYTSQEGTQFDSYPDYFDSDDSKNGKGVVKTKPGQLSLDNNLALLVSDPFSDFLLRHKTIGDIDDYINKILDVNTHEDFEGLVKDWRSQGMHNDDSTLIILEYDNENNWNILHEDDIEDLINNEEQKSSKLSAKENPENPENTENTESSVNLLIDKIIQAFIAKVNLGRFPKKIKKKILSKIIDYLKDVLKDVLNKYEFNIKE